MRRYILENLRSATPDTCYRASKKTPLTLPPDAPDLIKATVTRLSQNGDEVLDTLRRVSTGELEMIETITDASRDLTRRLFSWILEAEPVLAHAVDHPEVAALLGREHESLPGKINDDMITAAQHVPGIVIAAVRKFATDHRIIDPGFDALAQPIRELIEILDAAKREYDHGLTGLALVTASYVFYETFHYPQPATGVYDIAHSTADKLKWVYRYWFNQLEVAQRGSGLEDFFRGQVLQNSFPMDATEVESISRVSLSCAGDLLAVDVLTPENTTRLFEDITDFYSSTDIVSANLESTVYSVQAPGRNGEESGQPFKMNTSPEMFDRFRDDAGINFFSTATNHSNDRGTDGLLATLDVLDASGARYSGTARDQQAQDDVVVVERNGIKIALLTYTFDLNGRPVPENRGFLVNEVRFNDMNPGPDYSLVEDEVAAAKAKGAEFIVAFCHWGWEFEMYPHPNVTDAAHEVVARGVDVILGNHPHVPQPAQIIDRGPDKPKALVTYAFGDFVSYHPESRNSKLTYAIKFDIAKVVTAGGTYVSWDHLETTPLYIVNAHLGDDRYDCRIVHFDKVLENPGDFGLTGREKAELPHLENVVWKAILSPLSTIPPGGWSEPRPRG